MGVSVAAGSSNRTIPGSFATALQSSALLLLLIVPGTVVALDPADDLDADNMLDSWEVTNGLNPADPADADLDNDSDGVPNKGEFHLGSDPNDAASLPAFNDNYFESFESGTLPAPWFIPTDANKGWHPVNNTAHDGTWSLESDQTISFRNAEVVLPIYIHESGLNLWYYWNSAPLDSFRIYIDDVEVASLTDRPRTWWPSDQFPGSTYVLSEGYHEIRFFFRKVTTVAQACRCTRIDSVNIFLLDADFDSMPDDYELANGFDPNDPADAGQDADSDGLTNLQEFQGGTDPNDDDTDDDGLTDGAEVNLHGTDPLGDDSDADGLPDGWEVDFGLHPLNDTDAAADTDGDGVTNLEEFIAGTDPTDPLDFPTDFNDDYFESFELGSVPEGWTVPAGEPYGWTVRDQSAHDGTYSLQTENIPAFQDAVIELDIHVHLSDFQFQHYWNARVGDDFRVYLNDELIYNIATAARGWYPSPVFEIPQGYHTLRFEYSEDSSLAYGCKCVRIDSIQFTRVDLDEDGMRDGWETGFGLDPTDPSDAALDGDGDGLTNLEEFLNGANPNRPDTDFDGLNDGVEVNTHGTDPNDRDTDEDLIADAVELGFGFDPLDPADAELDADLDTYSNFVEVRLSSDPNNAASIPAVSVGYFESFEGALGPEWYVPEGEGATWYIDGSQSTEGAASFRSFWHSGGSPSSKKVAVIVNVVQGVMSLDYRHLETPGSNTCFRVRVDGSPRINSCNNHGFTSTSWNLSEGIHTIVFVHETFNATSQGYGRIDNLRFTALDADLDGMLDSWETANGLDPTDPSDVSGDLDSDGLNNKEEFLLFTQPDETDSDGDGLSDIDEIRVYFTDPARDDTDSDGMTDDYEVANGLDPRDRDDADLDPDNDGVSSYAESLYGTAANDPASTPAFMDNYFESFESGTLPAPWYVPASGDAGWHAEDLSASDGNWALVSDRVPHNDESHVVLPIVVHESEIQFDYYWNSSTNDALRVYLDDQLIEYISNAPRNWQTSDVHALSEGYHEIRFEYDEISSPKQACECVRIDNIRVTLLDGDTDRMPDSFELANGLNPADAADALSDLDGDGLNNLAEYQGGTLVNTPDTDGDGLNDGDEVNTHNTDPLLEDTDGDEMPDGWEIGNGLDPLVAVDASDDADNDNYANVVEFYDGLDPNVPDAVTGYNSNYSESFETGTFPAIWSVPPTADDGFTAKDVTASDGSWSIESEQIRALEEAAVELEISTHLADLEFDHYWNAYNGDELRLYVDGELVFASDDLPRGWFPSPVIEIKPGHHHIRFAYYEATNTSYGCKCVRFDNIRFTKVDADEDGMRDSWELANGLDPADPSDGLLDGDGDGLNNTGEYLAGTDITVVDSDGDGLSDGDEVNIHLTDPAQTDTDDDFIPDDYEVTHGLNPRVPEAGEDSDSDGYIDYHEFRLGSLPDDDSSVPPYLGDHIESFESGVLDSSWFDPDGAPLEWEIVNTDSTDGVNSLSNRTNPDNRFQWIHRIVNIRPSLTSLDARLDDFNCASYFVIYQNDTNTIYTNRCGEPGDPWETRPNSISPNLGNYPFIGGPLKEGVYEFRIRVDTTPTGHAYMDYWVFDEIAGP